MMVLYKEFLYPKKFIYEDSVADSTEDFKTCKFLISPFEKGYGQTVGNSLRRVLLSSIETPSIISFSMNFIKHMFHVVPGVKEDVVYITLNVKKIKLRFKDNEEHGKKTFEGNLYKSSMKVNVSQEDIDNSNGEYKCLAKDLFVSDDLELINPNLLVITFTKPMSFEVEFSVSIGLGFVPSDKIILSKKRTNEVILDVVFSPIVKVFYEIEEFVDFDKYVERLIITITSDRRVDPRDALEIASRIVMKNFNIFTEQGTVKWNTIGQKVQLNENDSEYNSIMNKLSILIDALELSVRSTNCLNDMQEAVSEYNKIKYLGQLVFMTEDEILGIRNFGKKSLYEIKNKLQGFGLSFDMKFNKFNINRTNIFTAIEKYLENSKKEDKDVKEYVSF